MEGAVGRGEGVFGVAAVWGELWECVSGGKKGGGGGGGRYAGVESGDAVAGTEFKDFWTDGDDGAGDVVALVQLEVGVDGDLPVLGVAGGVVDFDEDVVGAGSTGGEVSRPKDSPSVGQGEYGIGESMMSARRGLARTITSFIVVAMIACWELGVGVGVGRSQ